MPPRKPSRASLSAVRAVRPDVSPRQSTIPARDGKGARGRDAAGCAAMRAARGKGPRHDPATAIPPHPPDPSAETVPPADPQHLVTAMQRRFLGVAYCADHPDDTPCVVAPLRDYPATDPITDGAPDPSAPCTLTGLAGRLPGGLRFCVMAVTAPRPSPRAEAPDGPSPGVPPGVPRVVVMLRTPFGSAMTPFGGDGPALAGTLGAGADPWNLRRVHVERDAAVAWETAPHPGYGDDGEAVADTVTRLVTALVWRLLRADVRGGDAASLATTRGSDSHHARSVTGTAALALRTSVLLTQRPPDAVVGEDAPDLPGWVAAVCNRALHGCDPAGGLWPVARTGLWRDANNLACHSLAPRLRELREDAFTQAAELVALLEHPGPAGDPAAARFLAAIGGRWGFASPGNHVHTRTRIIRGPFGPRWQGEAHPILRALLRHPVARLDCRRPSASLTARTRAFADGVHHPYASLVSAEWGRFPGFDTPSGPADLACRADTAALPFDPEGTPDVVATTVTGPFTLGAPPVAPEALDPSRPGAGTVAALVVQPFTYAVDHPDLAVRTRALDDAMTTARRRNVARGVGGRGQTGDVGPRPDSFKAHADAIQAALLTPVLHLRAAPRTPGVCAAIMADLEAAFRGVAAWVREQYHAEKRGHGGAAVEHLFRCLHTAGTNYAEGRRSEAIAARYAVGALLRAGEMFARFGLPRVTVEYRAAVGVPDGLPTVSVWLPIPATALATGEPVAALAAEAITLVWHALVVGVGLVWGPEAHGAALAALPAPLSEATAGGAPDTIPGFDLGTAPTDPVDLARAITMTDLRHRVALGGAHLADPFVAPEGGEYRLGAPPLLLSCAAREDSPEATRALCGYADPTDLLGPEMWGRLSGVADPFPPDALRPPSPRPYAPYTGGRLRDREARLAVVRAALWPLAPGSIPRRVLDGASLLPPPLPTVVLPGGGAAAITGANRNRIARPIREALYLTGYLRPVTWRSVETVLPGVVPPPWEGALYTAPETVPDGRALPSEGRGVRLARDGAMRAEGEVRRTNRLGEAVVAFLGAAAGPAWAPHPDLRTVDPTRLVPPVPRPGKGAAPLASRAAVRAAVAQLDNATPDTTPSHDNPGGRDPRAGATIGAWPSPTPASSSTGAASTRRRSATPGSSSATGTTILASVST